jgi:hypothetical protein
VKAAVPAARERLAVLIERRAAEKAQRLYEERIRGEAEAVRAEFTVPPEEAPPAPEAPPHAGQVDLLEQVAEEQRREERDRIARELGLEPDES